MRVIKFRYWDGENMIDGDSLAFEEYAPISHLLTREGTMQFTGLTDKNGVEIYEGDVLEIRNDDYPFKNDWKGEVRMVNGGWACEDDGAADGVFIGYNEERVVVIGNIYENPNLLEVDDS